MSSKKILHILKSNRDYGGAELFATSLERYAQSTDINLKTLRLDDGLRNFIHFISYIIQCDKIIASDYRSIFVAYFLRLFICKNVTAIVHSNNNWSSKDEKLRKYLLNGMESVLAVGSRTEAYLSSKGVAVTDVIQPISPLFFEVYSEKTWNCREFDFAFVGRFEKEKNPLLAVEWVRELARILRRNSRSVFIGDGSMTAEVVEAGRVASKSSISFMGALTHKEAMQLLNNTRFLVVTSEREAGISLVSQEAILNGCKLISTDAGDLDKLSKNLRRKIGDCDLDFLSQAPKNGQGRDELEALGIEPKLVFEKLINA